MGGVRWGEKPEKEGWSIELVCDQKSGPEAPARNKIGREMREQRKCQGRSDGEKQVYQGH